MRILPVEWRDGRDRVDERDGRGALLVVDG